MAFAQPVVLRGWKHDSLTRAKTTDGSLPLFHPTTLWLGGIRCSVQATKDSQFKTATQQAKRDQQDEEMGHSWLARRFEPRVICSPS